MNMPLENIIVNGKFVLPTDAAALFEDENVHYTDTTELSVLMKELGIYSSSSIARRSGRHGPVPSGFTEFKASKKRIIWIWNPTE